MAGRLIYSAITSLDGYIEDQQGHFGWGEPDEEVFAFLNDMERQIGTCLYGRRMYETLATWETVPTDPGQPTVTGDFAEIWRAAEKIVYSRTLRQASTARTRIEREFDPAAVKQLKASASSDISIGGAQLAGQAMAAGLVDECVLYLVPILVGGGKRALPENVRVGLELLTERSFRNGVVYLRYQLAG